MIQRLSHACVYVLDMDDAKQFYIEKLGFEERNDVKMEGFRWLTVGPKTQPELEIVLMQPAPGEMCDAKTAELMRKLIERGQMGCGVFQTDDCQATYEELKAKGVTFLSPPQERPYGIEAILKDNSGNWYSLCQPAQ